MREGGIADVFLIIPSGYRKRATKSTSDNVAQTFLPNRD